MRSGHEIRSAPRLSVFKFNIILSPVFFPPGPFLPAAASLHGSGASDATHGSTLHAFPDTPRHKPAVPVCGSGCILLPVRCCAHELSFPGLSSSRSRAYCLRSGQGIHSACSVDVDDLLHQVGGFHVRVMVVLALIRDAAERDCTHGAEL